MLIVLFFVIVLWLEIYFVFGFFENILLWDVIFMVQGVESLELIIFGVVLIVILVFIIIMQLVCNLFVLLELVILQYLDLMLGMGYVIIIIIKYLLMLIGGLVGFLMIGIEWLKLQWLVVVLGVGFGFGLQEIFVNFIFGLIILFEKLICIGDMVIICDFIGSVMKINICVIIISDWDCKEIIVLNKVFIIEQFINWLFFDLVMCVVLMILVFVDVNSEEVMEILFIVVCCCLLVIDNLVLEVFLVDL